MIDSVVVTLNLASASFAVMFIVMVVILHYKLD
jgi:hypothetical protein